MTKQKYCCEEMEMLREGGCGVPWLSVPKECFNKDYSKLIKCPYCGTKL